MYYQNTMTANAVHVCEMQLHRSAALTRSEPIHQSKCTEAAHSAQYIIHR